MNTCQMSAYKLNVQKEQVLLIIKITKMTESLKNKDKDPTISCDILAKNRLSTNYLIQLCLKEEEKRVTHYL